MAGKVQQNEEMVDSSASDEHLHSRLSASELFLEMQPFMKFLIVL